MAALKWLKMESRSRVQWLATCTKCKSERWVEGHCRQHNCHVCGHYMEIFHGGA